MDTRTVTLAMDSLNPTLCSYACCDNAKQTLSRQQCGSYHLHDNSSAGFRAPRWMAADELASSLEAGFRQKAVTP